MIKKVELGTAMNAEMGSFSQVTDAEFMYMELANGSQVKMRKSDFLLAYTLLNIGNMKDSNLLEMRNVIGYAYSSSDSSGVTGPFISFGIEQYQAQIKVNADGLKMKFRVVDNGIPTEWKSISFT